MSSIKKCFFQILKMKDQNSLIFKTANQGHSFSHNQSESITQIWVALLVIDKQWHGCSYKEM